MEYTSNGITIKIERKELNTDDIKQYLRDKLPKIIFKDEDYRLLSYEEMKYDEHQLKKIFKGQTYITFNVIHNFTNGFKIVSDKTDCNALVKVSKRDIRTKYPLLRIAAKEDVYEQAKCECEQFLNEYEALLNDYVFDVVIADNDKKYLKEVKIIADKDAFIDKVITEYKSDITFVSERTLVPFDNRIDKLMTELYKQSEYNRLFIPLLLL